MTEKEVQEFLESNLKKILTACVKFQNLYTPRPKFRLSNGIESDLGVLDASGRVVALFESKGEVGINELVRGIGQVSQYQSHIDQKILHNYAPGARAFLVIPREVYENIDFQKLVFPKGSGIILIDEENDSFILLTKKRVSSGNFKNIVIISPYYVRDNRLGEIYLGLKMVEAMSPRSSNGAIKAKELHGKLEKIIKNKGNARNITISLHGLGFLDYDNRLTAEGQRHLRMNYNEFCRNIALNQLAPFLNLLMTTIVTVATEKKQRLNKVVTTPTELRKKIISLFGGSDVLYLTDSRARYISSWLNILRDDLGAISFYPGNYSKGISINYFPLKGYPFLLEKTSINKNCREVEYIEKGLKTIRQY